LKLHPKLTRLEARRLALARAGLLKPEWTSFPTRAKSAGRRARKACHHAISRFGYLQLDTISIAGSRSHEIFLMSRLEGLDGALPEELLQPGEPLFEYWGHEASWIPIELYPVFAFRRKDRRAGTLNILSSHFEDGNSSRNREAAGFALERYSRVFRLKPIFKSSRR
jgi:uncharacterized protein YcaQ